MREFSNDFQSNSQTHIQFRYPSSNSYF
jgi:hypothetical protein